MKLASLMQKSYFMGRKVIASLCRKEKPVSEALPQVPRHLSMKRTSETSLLEQVESQDMQSWQQFLNVGKQAAIKPGKLDPENNGKRANIVRYLEDQQKYQVSLEGRFVKLKPENVEAVEEPLPKRLPKALEEEEEEEADENAEASAQVQAFCQPKPASSS
eukprot:g26962.t1